MPVPRRRHSKSKRDKARTHKLLQAHSPSRCKNCGAARRPHQACPSCGQYNGRSYRTTVTS
ncbi:MAG TPA: 50S ribosomal protein L32 [Candidatus Sumerlaeota bacterium]|nr:MAG: 50S ribosomal protein L32 [candidate division BRC1 bacterium ADurb.BinA292]HOE97485.1 50S ribosomal protein L32 [Candidatus Sumerlaeota bacterium]HOR29256.1 50S ribosomal protein L32 [Candidatus Sumerlaeota bacterium]HPK03330.1 50S ribosomal protein L32 [Candidatus Sumerlaeota bacterium]